MTRKFRLSFLVLPAALLAACASATPTTAPQPVLLTDEAANSVNPSPPPPESPAPPNAGETLARTDSQASVEFVVTPLNLNAPSDTLDFDVSLNTHSVDLSWDLAAQSVLSTDSGLEVGGLNWPVGGGHHYGGTLTFPAKTADGTPLLKGAKTLTLTVRDAGVTERVFVWELSN